VMGRRGQSVLISMRLVIRVLIPSA
jgi:hypothetical protein